MKTYLCLTLLNIATFPGLLFEQYVEIQDNSLDINHFLYGDITKMDHMFINPEDYEDSGGKQASENEQIRRRQDVGSAPTSGKTISFELLANPFNNSGFDINDFNAITISLNNITRRYDYDDPADWYTYKELYKKGELINAGLQFLIHSRYKVMSAVKQKEPIKLTKRYRMGYLFNRLRRILYEMSKIMDQAVKREYYVTTPSTLRMYDQIIRYQVDVKDTIEFIKSIDIEPDDIPVEEVATQIPNMEEET